MKNSERFLDAFNRIQKHLKQIMQDEKRTEFSLLVNLASKRYRAVYQFAADLREFGELRNAIVHDSRGGCTIADPNEWAVRRIEHIATTLDHPPKVIPLFQKEVLAVSNSDSLSIVVKSMLEKSFSQIPVYAGLNFIGLLTTDTVTRWLGACVKDDIFILTETTISDVLKYGEDPDNHCFLRKNALLFDVLEKFRTYEKRGNRLEAILITENGRQEEQPIGVITAWDLTKIYKKLGLHES